MIGDPLGSFLYMGPYVYKLVDPRDGSVFYVGKGRNRRAWSHEAVARRGGDRNGAKASRICEILDAGLRVRVELVSEHKTDHEAGMAERALIAAIGLANLTNRLSGGQLGAATLDEMERFRREIDDAIRDTVGLLLALKPRADVRDKAGYDWVANGLRKLLRMEIDTFGVERALNVLRTRGARVSL